MKSKPILMAYSSMILPLSAKENDNLERDTEFPGLITNGLPSQNVPDKLII